MDLGGWRDVEGNHHHISSNFVAYTVVPAEDAGAVEGSALSKNPAAAVPYLVIMVLLMVMGCIGNVLVIGAVYTNKVGAHSIELENRDEV